MLCRFTYPWFPEAGTKVRNRKEVLNEWTVGRQRIKLS